MCSCQNTYFTTGFLEARCSRKEHWTVSDFFFFFFQIEFVRTNLAVRGAVLGVAVSERLSWSLRIKWTITVTIIIKSSLQNC